MWAKPRPHARILSVVLLVGLFSQTPYALTWDVDGNDDVGRRNVNLILSIPSSRAIDRSDPADADDDWEILDLDPCIGQTGWAQDLWKISSDLTPNLDFGQALPTRKTLTRNGSTFDKPDGDPLGPPRSFGSLPTTKPAPPQNPTEANPAFAFEILTTYAVHCDESAEMRAAAIFGGSSRVVRSPGGSPRC